MKRREVIVVVDLGFGDAGKGSVTDALVHRKAAHTVVRFNGGAQAGHNVVTPDGRHHTFAQLGAGTFVPGVRTHLSRHVVVHPAALLVEARRLEASGVPDSLERLTISEEALLTTPVHQAAARLRELARGDARHGSCGVGVGETVSDAIVSPTRALRAKDLGDASTLRSRLLEHQARKRSELEEPVRAMRGLASASNEILALEDRRVVEAWIDQVGPLRRLVRGLVVPDEHLVRLLRAPGVVLFEGAQGVLLDEWHGFHPHTTWSTCTFDNALALVHESLEADCITRLGVLRTYATRHGPGPFPTEAPEIDAALEEPHNDAGPWQGAFRRGWLDLVLARYAVDACGGLDGIALTHLDAIPRLARWRVCTSYRLTTPAPHLFLPSARGEAVALRPGAARDLAHTAALGQALGSVVPLYEDHTAESLPRCVEEQLGAPVLLRSSGPTAIDKAFSGGLAS